MSPVPQKERRAKSDRRKSPPQPISIYSAIGNRIAPCRRDDAVHKPYVDLYSWRSFGLILAVLTMSILDGFFTLYLVDAGAQEVNPIMRYALSHSPIFFSWPNIVSPAPRSCFFSFTRSLISFAAGCG